MLSFIYNNNNKKKIQLSTFFKSSEAIRGTEVEEKSQAIILMYI